MLITQSSLAKQLNAPLRSIKLALAELEKSGSVFKNAVIRGRKSFTIIIDKIYQNCKKLMVHTGIHYGREVSRGEQTAFFSQYHELDVCLQL